MADTDRMPPAQTLALVECMIATAQIDGVQPRELTLLRSFYETQWESGMPSFELVLATAGREAGLLASVKGDAPFADQLVMMCLVTGYADGKLTEAERLHVLDIARQLGVGEAQFGQLHQQVKDSLIGSLAHLPDAESVAALAKNL